MKASILYVLGSQLVLANAWSALSCNIDCNTDVPCGAEELICCAAFKANQTAEEELFKSGEDYYNQVLFNKDTLDGFCKNPGSGTLLSPLQNYYYNNFCTKNAGSYFSYANFIAAANTPIFNTPPTGGGFACVGDAATRYKELSNFLTTIAQETTGVNPSRPYTNDGLYFRYENSYLQSCSTVPSPLALNTPCSAPPDLSAAYTNYYPTSNYVINYNGVGSYNTKYLYLAPGPNYTIYNIWSTPEFISFGAATTPLIQLNDPSVLFPGYWVGMGAKQLTGNSMYEFFGWYQNNIASPANLYGNFQDFVTGFLTDGTVGFQGAFWYWMFRVNGSGYRPIHQMVTNYQNDGREVCTDIAAVTMMVNGGCNNYDPGRLTYYSYFNGNFKIETNQKRCTVSSDITSTYPVIPSGTVLGSLTCNAAAYFPNPAPLQLYCQSASLPTPGVCN